MAIDVNPRATAEPPPESAPPDAAPTSSDGAWRLVLERLGEVKEYATYFVSAKIDSLMLTVRKVGIAAALGVVGLMALATIVVMMFVLLALGVADAYAALLGGRRWAGELLAFASFAVVIGVGVWVGLRMVTSGSRKKTLEKYERRQEQQRAKYGTDVGRRADEDGGGEVE